MCGVNIYMSRDVDCVNMYCMGMFVLFGSVRLWVSAVCTLTFMSMLVPESDSVVGM